MTKDKRTYDKESIDRGRELLQTQGLGPEQRSNITQESDSPGQALLELFHLAPTLCSFMERTGATADRITQILNGMGDNTGTAIKELVRNDDIIYSLNIKEARYKLLMKVEIRNSPLFLALQTTFPEITPDHVLKIAAPSTRLQFDKNPVTNIRKTMNSIINCSESLLDIKKMGFSLDNVVYLFSGAGTTIEDKIASFMADKEKISELIESFQQKDQPIDALTIRLQNEKIDNLLKTERASSKKQPECQISLDVCFSDPAPAKKYSSYPKLTSLQSGSITLGRLNTTEDGRHGMKENFPSQWSFTDTERTKARRTTESSTISAHHR